MYHKLKKRPPVLVVALFILLAAKAKIKDSAAYPDRIRAHHSILICAQIEFPSSHTHRVELFQIIASVYCLCRYRTGCCQYLDIHAYVHICWTPV